MATAKAAAVAPAKALAVVKMMTNEELWNAARKESPTFLSHTAQATKDLFTEQGYAEITREGMDTLNEFFRLSMRVVLTRVNISHAKDPLAESGFGEMEYQPYGQYSQRMHVDSIKPVSAAYNNLQDGQSVDPFIIRKPTMGERFFGRNFDYQSFITMQDFNLKQVFISSYGVSELVSGVMAGLMNGWIIQKYVNKLEVLNAAINDDALKETQIVGVDYAGTWTDDSLRSFILKVMDIVTMMTISAQSSAYNSAGFNSLQDRGRLKLLVRAGYGNALRVMTLAGTYNPEQLNLNLDIIEVEHFGGITYQTTGGTPLYPAYSKLGEEIGLNEAEGQETATHQKNDPDVVAVDPNKDVVAILADKAFMFETTQNEYRVEAIHNPRGLYNNYWASAPNNGIHYDRLYNFVVFRAATA